MPKDTSNLREPLDEEFVVKWPVRTATSGKGKVFSFPAKPNRHLSRYESNDVTNKHANGFLMRYKCSTLG